MTWAARDRVAAFMGNLEAHGVRPADRQVPVIRETIMKILSMTCLTFFLILLAMPVEAESPDNVLGLYFDTNANTTCMEWMMPGGTQTMYLILSNPTMPTIYGYECGISL